MLKLLRQEILPPREFDIIHYAISVNNLTHALSVWAEFLTADFTLILDALLKRVRGVSNAVTVINAGIELADDKLFTASHTEPTQCAQYLSPPSDRSLQSRDHNCTLPKCKHA